MVPKQSLERVEKITVAQMKQAIFKSGYLLEQRVRQPIEHGFGPVEPNPIYIDPYTKNARELDMAAYTGKAIYDDDPFSAVRAKLLCECENNSQPVVFFITGKKDIRLGDIKCSGLPVMFQDDEVDELAVGLGPFVRADEFHHYCSGEISTQYCTFQMKKDKSGWMAVHNEEQHDTLSGLVKAVEYNINEHYEHWTFRPDGDEPVDVCVYYPLVILEGDLFTARLKNGRLAVSKSEHVQFRTQGYSSQTASVENYQIDIISEAYLPKYLKLIGAEIAEIQRVYAQEKEWVFKCLRRIVADTRDAQVSPQSYRKHFDS